MLIYYYGIGLDGTGRDGAGRGGRTEPASPPPGILGMRACEKGAIDREADLSVC